MGTKLEPGQYDCHDKALPDEPRFTLLARDPSAPDLIRTWADVRAEAIAAGERPDSDTEAVIEARQLADRMDAWRIANDGAWRQA